MVPLLDSNLTPGFNNFNIKPQKSENGKFVWIISILLILTILFSSKIVLMMSYPFNSRSKFIVFTFSNLSNSGRKPPPFLPTTVILKRSLSSFLTMSNTALCAPPNLKLSISINIFEVLLIRSYFCRVEFIAHLLKES